MEAGRLVIVGAGHYCAYGDHNQHPHRLIVQGSKAYSKALACPKTCDRGERETKAGNSVRLLTRPDLRLELGCPRAGG